MNDSDAVTVIAALAHPTRLGALQLLAKKSDGLPASELASLLGVARNAMSPHLKTLTSAGLVGAERQGRGIVYSIRADMLEQVAIRLQKLASPD